MGNKKTVILELGFGISLPDAADLAIKLATERNSDITLAYNQVNINVSPNTTQQHIINHFFSAAMALPNMGMVAQQTQTL